MVGPELRIGAYPGSFDPPTVAHLAVADAARHQGRLDRIDLILSEVALGKESHAGPPASDRLAVLERLSVARPWLRARVTSDRLLVDIAAGYDALILGADKWHQLVDPAWYGGTVDARDAVMARLPHLLVAPRPPFALPAASVHVTVLTIDESHGPVSSTAVRRGHREWIAGEAARSPLWGCTDSPDGQH